MAWTGIIDSTQMWLKPDFSRVFVPNDWPRIVEKMSTQRVRPAPKSEYQFPDVAKDDRSSNNRYSYGQTKAIVRLSLQTSLKIILNGFLIGFEVCFTDVQRVSSDRVS